MFQTVLSPDQWYSLGRYLIKQQMFIWLKPLLVKHHLKSCFYHGLVIKPLANTCWWRASPTQLAGSLATAFLVMTSEWPNTLGCMGHALCPGSLAIRVISADASCRIATPGHLPFSPCTSVWIQDCPNLSLFLPRCAPFFAAHLHYLVSHLWHR